MDALLVIDKPLGLTSFDVVAKVRRLLGERRIGHAGTLDPLASGVLLLCLGEMTKLVPYLMDADKEYLATARLGVATDTDDADPKAQVLSRASERELFALREADVRAALGRMVGDVLQRPPRFSALKLDGQRLYAQARKARKPAAYEPVLSPGPEVAAQSAAAELADAADAAIEAATAQKTRVVHIAAIEVESMRLSQVGDPPGTLPEVTFRVRCGKGTYIRSLARDLGEALGVGGHLSSLRRLRVGPFDLRGAVHPEDAAQAPRFGLRDAVAHLPQLVLSDADSGRLRNGQPAVLRELVPRLSALPLGPTGDGIAAVAALDERGALIAILQPAPGSTPSDPAGAAGPAASGRPQRWQIARGFSQSSAAAAAPTEEAPCITGCA